MNLNKKVFCSIVLGLVITLISSLIPNMEGMLGAQQYGFPFFWLTQMVYPGSPSVINWVGLVADIIIWTIVILIIIQGLSLKFG